VGVVIYSSEEDALLVDTLLLSCRVLGRGVEHEIVRTLGCIAVERGLERVVVPFIATKKNLPARRFLDSLAAARDAVTQDGTADGVRYSMPAERAAVLVYAPGDGAVELPKEATPSLDNAPAKAASVRKSVRWNRIARDLCSPHQILAELARAPRRARAVGAPAPVPARTPLE